MTLYITNVPQALGGMCQPIIFNIYGLRIVQFIALPFLYSNNLITDFINPARPLVVSGLFKHEHKMSVVHFAVQRVPSFTEPLKSKVPVFDLAAFETIILSYPLYECRMKWWYSADSGDIERDLFIHRILLVVINSNSRGSSSLAETLLPASTLQLRSLPPQS